MRISPARIAAFDVLRECELNEGRCSDLLAETDQKLSSQDAALCREIVLGVLRRQMLLDAMIGQITGNRKLDVEVALSIRIGAFQLLYLDKVPAYAAINDSVDLVRRYRRSSAASLVNAALRKLQQGPPILEYVDDIEKLSVETSHPRFLIEKWIADHGFEVASAVANSNNQRPGPAFRLLREIPKELIGQYSVSGLVAGCYLADAFDGTIIGWMRDGSIYIQDEGSQVISSLVDIPAGSKFLDLCASPGGKTGAIASRSHSADPLIVAADVSTARVRILKQNLRVQGHHRVSVVQLDGTRDLPFEIESFDRVLVDAPCTGTGTIRHNPEIRYRVNADRISAAKDKQLKLLRNSSKLVRKGGKLIYSTCSLEPEENEHVCAEFAALQPEFVNITSEISLDKLTASGFLRTWPHRDGTDGFFAAVFQRR